MAPTSAARRSRRLAPVIVSAITLALLVGSGLIAPTSEAASRKGNHLSSKAIRYGLAKLGDPYRWGASGPRSFDCSGLTQSAYKRAGVSIPRVSRDQYHFGPKVSRSNWRPGDLIFWASNTSSPSSIHHVGIFMGAGQVLHASRPGTPVQISRIWSRGLMPRATRPAGRRAKHLLKVRPGEQGANVRVVQHRLRANGFRIPVSGVHDKRTQSAVRRAKNRAGIKQSSTVGPNVWRYLVRNGARNRAA